MIVFVLPDAQAPSGGVRKAYAFVDILNDAGMPAVICHMKRNFRCRWFDNRTPVVSVKDLLVTSADVLVLPEIYGKQISSVVPGVPRVVLCQNDFYLYGDADMKQVAAVNDVYSSSHDLLGALVVSSRSQANLRYAFPSLEVHRIVYAVDPSIYSWSGEGKQRQIAYMPRKRPGDAVYVGGVLSARGALDGWRMVAIDGMSEAQVASVLRQSAIFVSLSDREGFGLPPVEAMAAGCLVVGYDGYGGSEYFTSNLAFPVPDGDVVALTRAIEAAIELFEQRPADCASMTRRASEHVCATYSPEAEAKTVIGAFQALSSRVPGHPETVQGRLRRHDLEPGRRVGPRARRATRRGWAWAATRLQSGS